MLLIIKEGADEYISLHPITIVSNKENHIDSKIKEREDWCHTLTLRQKDKYGLGIDWKPEQSFLLFYNKINNNNNK